MNIVLSIIYFVLICAFMVAYVGCFILNLIRAKKVNDQMKKECAELEGKVISVEKTKKSVIVKVEYASPTNHVKFVDVFEFNAKNFNDQYYENQTVSIYYPIVKDLKRVTYFPTYLSDVNNLSVAKEEYAKRLEEAKNNYTAKKALGLSKEELEPFKNELMVAKLENKKVQKTIQMVLAPLVTDALLGAVGIFMTWYFLNMALTNVKAGTGFLIFKDVASTEALSCASNSMLVLLLPLFMYITTIPYLMERITTASKDENQNYLKLYGAKCMAEVKTFKFGRSKNAKGNKESLLEIEFYNNKGELIKTSLSSFMYTETQEQFINILYDVKNPKNVVYMRK